MVASDEQMKQGSLPSVPCSLARPREMLKHGSDGGGWLVACVAGWLVSWSVLVCAFVCAFVSAFVCSFRGLFACVLSWVEILYMLKHAHWRLEIDEKDKRHWSLDTDAASGENVPRAALDGGCTLALR